MSFDALGELNWLAVIVAAGAYFALGAAWYARPVFGKTWAAAGGIEMPEGERPNPAIFVAPLFGSVLSAIGLGMLTAATNTDTLAGGLALGLTAGVGFAVPISLITAVFESTKPQPMVWGVVNAGYHAVGILIAALILSIWT